MVTTAETPDEPTTPERAERWARLIISGHEAGAVRRILLYVAALASIALAVYWPPILVIAAVVTLLLSATDQLL